MNFNVPANATVSLVSRPRLDTARPSAAGDRPRSAGLCRRRARRADQQCSSAGDRRRRAARSVLVYRSLLGYFPAALLQKCRFAVGTTRALTLPALAFSYGDATAITLGDVVLFKDERVAETDLKLWAHELTHVMQYQRWGTEGFADRYVRDSAAVEQEAIDNANRFAAWLPRRGLPPAGP